MFVATPSLRLPLRSSALPPVLKSWCTSKPARDGGALQPPRGSGKVLDDGVPLGEEAGVGARL